MDFLSTGDASISLTGTVSVGTSTDFGLYAISCTNNNGDVVYTRVLYDGSLTSPFAVRNQVRASLRIPQPEPDGSPPLTERFSVVHIPTWFWVTNHTELTNTDTIGGLTISVTATPTDVTWDPGDGSKPIVCDGPGTIWTGDSPDAETDCSHTYRRSTAGQPDNQLTVTASITWELSWTLNGTDQGIFETYQTTTAIPHQVGEIPIPNVRNSD
jgi:hypothetical protein